MSMMNTEKLNRYLKGDSSQKEKEEIQLWLEENEENKAEFMSLRTLYDMMLGALPDGDSTRQSSVEKKNIDCD